jgi:hypothetical protein
MKAEEHMKIGRFHSWMEEDGSLKLYSHKFGDSSGFSCTLSAEEARGLLDLLSRHQEDINVAIYTHEAQQATKSSYAGGH